MSVDATRWAWAVEVSSSTKRLVLLALADRAGEEHTCYPSAMRMVKDTNLNRKTILTAINDLIADGLLLDTGERKGNGVRVLKLVGVFGRENDTYPKKITSTKNDTSTEIGMTTSTEIGMTTDPKNGIQNLKGNLKGNLKKEFSEKFEKFWSAYPKCKRKSDKVGTSKTFKKYSSEFDVDFLISILEKQKADNSWIKQNGEFIPAPTVWLNQKQWENEYWLDQKVEQSATQQQQVKKEIISEWVEF